MRSRNLGALAALLPVCLAGSTQSQTSDTLQALKNSLSPDQQGSILQQVLGGKGSGTGKKTDQKLETPDTMRDKTNEQWELEKERDQKSLDGRLLRQMEEDPELRADDTVLIELISLDELCNSSSDQNGDQNNGNGPHGKNGAAGIAALPVIPARRGDRRAAGNPAATLNNG